MYLEEKNYEPPSKWQERIENLEKEKVSDWLISIKKVRELQQWLLEAIHENQRQAAEILIEKFHTQLPLRSLKTKLLDIALYENENVAMATLLATTQFSSADAPLLSKKLSGDRADKNLDLCIEYIQKIRSIEENEKRTDKQNEYLSNYTLKKFLEMILTKSDADKKIKVLVLLNAAPINTELLKEACRIASPDTLRALTFTGQEEKPETHPVIHDKMLEETYLGLFKDLASPSKKTTENFLHLLSAAKQYEPAKFFNASNKVTESVDHFVDHHWAGILDYHKSEDARPEIARTLLTARTNKLDQAAQENNNQQVKHKNQSNNNSNKYEQRDALYRKLHHLIVHAKDPMEIIKLLDDVFENQQVNFSLVSRRGKFSSALRGYHWNNQPVSSQWVKTIQMAKLKIQTLVSSKQNELSEDDLKDIKKFTEEPTVKPWTFSFFAQNHRAVDNQQISPVMDSDQSSQIKVR